MTIEEQIQEIRDQIRDNGEQAITGDGLGDVLVDMVETLDGAKIGEASRDGKQYGRKDGEWAEIETAGTYADLPDKPSINGVTLQDNKTAAQLGLQPQDFIAQMASPRKTTFEEVLTAYNAGRNVYLYYEVPYMMTAIKLYLKEYTGGAAFYFRGYMNNSMYSTMLTSDNTWSAVQQTVLATSTDLEGKQDKINDLATIRSNAQAGAAIVPLVPAQASSTNQLADKAFVNSTVQTGTANFRGNWATLAAVPTDASLYPADYAGNHTPTVNDYMVVQSDEEHDGATWRYKYSGDWATDGKDGWQAEYEVNETPMTVAQLAAINSGITAAEVQRLNNLSISVENYTLKITI